MHPLTIYVFAACLFCVRLIEWKALDEFVKLPDPYYNYTFKGKEIHAFLTAGAVLHTIEMTSQKWLDESEVDKPVWQHTLIIAVPTWRKEIKNSCFIIVVPERKNNAVFPSDNFLAALASRSKSMVALLTSVPVQPLTFYKHPLGYENITGYDILAYSWWRFLNDSNAPPHWLLQFPMVKATMKAIDTVKDFMMKTHHRNITQITLAGFSMNGWIPWMTAAVDSRVTSIMPIGMDFLNFTENFHHQYRAYCGWSYKLRPFYEMNITEELDSLRFKELASHVDPVAYIERYTNISKYIIVASGDAFFQPESSHYYFSQLKGEKNLNIIPNVDETFGGLSLLFNPILAFYMCSNFHQQYQPYCDLSYMLGPVHELNITQWLDDPHFKELVSQVDPRAHSERYTNISEHMIVASWDEFSQSDNPHYYFSQLVGKNVSVHPVLASMSMLFDPILGYYELIVLNQRRSQFSSQRIMTNTSGIIYFSVTLDALQVFSYHVDVDTRRDFRMNVAAGNSSQDNSVKWIRTSVEREKSGIYKKEMEIPAKGWRAFFIQATFAGHLYRVTSEIHVIPDTFPCPDCNGEGCRGTLV